MSTIYMRYHLAVLVQQDAGDEPDAVLHVCPHRMGGATASSCEELTAQPHKNRAGCVEGMGRFPPCNSWRRKCVQCLEEGMAPERAGYVFNVSSGLCEVHLESHVLLSPRVKAAINRRLEEIRVRALCTELGLSNRQACRTEAESEHRREQEARANVRAKERAEKSKVADHQRGMGDLRTRLQHMLHEIIRERGSVLKQKRQKRTRNTLEALEHEPPHWQEITQNCTGVLRDRKQLPNLRVVSAIAYEMLRAGMKGTAIAARFGIGPSLQETWISYHLKLADVFADQVWDLVLNRGLVIGYRNAYYLARILEETPEIQRYETAKRALRLD